MLLFEFLLFQIMLTDPYTKMVCKSCLDVVKTFSLGRATYDITRAFVQIYRSAGGGPQSSTDECRVCVRRNDLVDVLQVGCEKMLEAIKDTFNNIEVKHEKNRLI